MTDYIKGASCPKGEVDSSYQLVVTDGRSLIALLHKSPGGTSDWELADAIRDKLVQLESLVAKGGGARTISATVSDESTHSVGVASTHSVGVASKSERVQELMKEMEEKKKKTKPSEESNDHKTINKPSGESNDHKTINKPSGESNDHKTINKPSGESNDHKTINKPSGESNDHKTINKPSGESNDHKTINKPSGESNDETLGGAMNTNEVKEGKEVREGKEVKEGKEVREGKEVKEREKGFSMKERQSLDPLVTVSNRHTSDEEFTHLEYATDQVNK